MAAAAEASEDPDGPEPGEDSHDSSEEPEIYDFTEDSGYSVGDLEPAYEVLEGSYWIDEENENVVVADSSWNQVEEMLEADQEESSNNSWKEKAKGYLFDHNRTYMKAGLGGMGTGLLSSGLGYATAADFLFTGGAMSFGWGLGGVIGNYLFGDEEGEIETESTGDTDSELHGYKDWDVEVVDLQAYGQALREYED